MSISRIRSLIQEILLIEAEDQHTALVIGDSQAQGMIGANVEKFLKNSGYGTTRKSFPGRPGRDILENLKTYNLAGFSLVVAIFGGNDASVASATSALTAIYDLCNASNVKLIVIGPPPATIIKDLDLARKMFGESVVSADWHLKRDNGAYPAKRINIAAAIDNFDDGKSNIATYGIAARKTWPESYPSQPDGVHCVNGAQEITNEIMNECLTKLDINW